MPALMRPNPVRANLQAGGNVYGTLAFEFFSPGLNLVSDDQRTGQTSLPPISSLPTEGALLGVSEWHTWTTVTRRLPRVHAPSHSIEVFSYYSVARAFMT